MTGRRGLREAGGSGCPGARSWQAVSGVIGGR